jgi:hypothetical protein
MLPTNVVFLAAVCILTRITSRGCVQHAATAVSGWGGAPGETHWTRRRLWSKEEDGGEGGGDERKSAAGER